MLPSSYNSGVDDACGRGVDPSLLPHPRHLALLRPRPFRLPASSALLFPPPSSRDSLPKMLETESQCCTDALLTSLASRDICLPHPNATCDAAHICLHEMGSLSYPTDFNCSATMNRFDATMNRLEFRRIIRAMEGLRCWAVL